MQVVWAIQKVGGNERFVMSRNLHQFNELCGALRAIEIDAHEEQASVFASCVHSIFDKDVYPNLLKSYGKQRKRLRLERPKAQDE